MDPATITPTQLPDISPEPASVVRNRRWPRWLVIVVGAIVAIVVLSVATVVIMNMVTDAPKQVSDKFMKDVQTNDSNAAYTLTTAAFKTASPESAVVALFTRISPLMQGNFTVTARKVVSQSGITQAEFTYDVSTAAGHKYTRVLLKDNSAGWQVEQFNSSDSPLTIDI